MAPPNPHSTPYLSLRAGTNGFYYRRQIPAGQRDRLQGDLQLHNGRLYGLAGKAALKISLGTTDVRLAERRMRSINGEVQRLLDGGGSVLASPARAASAVTSLTDGQIRALAEQHHYRLLANDDLVQLDPENDPEGVIEYLRLSGENVGAPDFDARRAIDLFVEINLETARGNIRSGHWQTFLAGIEEEDDDGTPIVVLSVVDELLQQNGLTLAEPVRMDAIGKRGVLGSDVSDSVRSGFHPALRLWAEVLSVQPSGLGICGFGLRDAAVDQGMPVPLALWRGGRCLTSLDESTSVRKCNDKHAFVTLGDRPAQFGDVVEFGLCHPCTNIQRHRAIYAAGDDGRIVDVYETYFG